MREVELAGIDPSSSVTGDDVGLLQGVCATSRKMQILATRNSWAWEDGAVTGGGEARLERASRFQFTVRAARDSGRSTSMLSRRSKSMRGERGRIPILVELRASAPWGRRDPKGAVHGAHRRSASAVVYWGLAALRSARSRRRVARNIPAHRDLCHDAGRWAPRR